LDEVADLLGISTQTVAVRAERGKLPAPIRIGRRWLFPSEALHAHLEQLPRNTRATALAGRAEP
jgi:excisionase family DNA binding protein